MIEFPSVRPAQVLLVNRQSFLGAMIRHVTGYPWTHAALIEGSKWAEEPWTIEAHDLEGVKHCRLQDYAEDPAILALAIYDDPSLTREDRDAICEFAETLNGRPYDTDQLLGIYWHRRFPGQKPDQNRLDSLYEIICTELIGRSYAHRRRNLCPPGIGLGCLAPGDITVMLTQLWFWKKEIPDEIPAPSVPVAPDPPGGSTQ